jgi:hypothetical protein
LVLGFVRAKSLTMNGTGASRNTRRSLGRRGSSRHCHMKGRSSGMMDRTMADRTPWKESAKEQTTKFFFHSFSDCVHFARNLYDAKS